MGICTTFVDLASWTWRQMEKSVRLQSPFNEETITEHILLELKDRHPDEVMVEAFVKKKENANGADWELWFLDHAGKKGFGLRVQAKRLYHPGKTYGSLKASETKTDAQINKLIDDAKANKLVPIYCFYNYVQDQQEVESVWRCGSFFPLPESFGCAVASAEAVRANGKNDFASISEISAPWHCLVCGPVAGEGGTSGPDRVSSVVNGILLQELHSRFVDEWIADFMTSSPSVDGESTIGFMTSRSFPGDELGVGNPPTYVSKLFQNFLPDSSEGEEDTRQFVYEQSKAEDRGLNGIVLIRDPEPAERID